MYVYVSAYGWKIDQDKEAAQLMQEIQSGTQTTREPVYSMRANSDEDLSTVIALVVEEIGKDNLIIDEKKIAHGKAVSLT